MSQDYQTFILLTAQEFQNNKFIVGHLKQGSTWLMEIARALITTPVWSDMHKAVMVVRESPQPIMGILGSFDAAEKARVVELGRQLQDALARLCYVTYAQAEQDVELLATKLIERFGRETLSNCQFEAIPRGGLFVLGMVAYALDLKHKQLLPPRLPDVPLVIVDDCALSGTRFGNFIDRYPEHQIIFAHLYSHPDLRAAIERQESNIVACISAHDLDDYAPEKLGKYHSEWYQGWTNRLDGKRYWIGQPEHICFPWSEPDRSFWNYATQQVECAWRVVPPQLCLKNRWTLDTSPSRLQIQSEGKGPLKPSANVLFGDLDGQIIIGDAKTDRSYQLDSVGSDIWKAIIDYGNLDQAVVSLLNVYEVEEATLRMELESFVAYLLSQELLEINS